MWAIRAAPAKTSLELSRSHSPLNHSPPLVAVEPGCVRWQPGGPEIQATCLRTITASVQWGDLGIGVWCHEGLCWCWCWCWCRWWWWGWRILSEG
jgi:hypothetical protein